MDRNQDEHQLHSDHHRAMIRDFRTRFFITLLLSLPVIGLAGTIQGLLGYSLGFPGADFLVFGLSTVIFSTAAGHSWSG